MKRDPIERIEDGLRGLGAEHEPPAGWDKRVLDATAPRPLTLSELAIRVLVAIAGAALIAAFVIWIVVGG